MGSCRAREYAFAAMRLAVIISRVSKTMAVVAACGLSVGPVKLPCDHREEYLDGPPETFPGIV